MTRTSHRVVPSKAEQRERCVRARDEDEDHRVVEAARPQPPRRALPREAVVERARAEHRGERCRVHPRRERRERAVRQDDEHRPRGQGGEERPLVEEPTEARRQLEAPSGPLSHARSTAAARSGERAPPRLHSPGGPLAQLVEQGTFNPKVAGSNPARPTRVSELGAAPNRSNHDHNQTHRRRDARSTYSHTALRRQRGAVPPPRCELARTTSAGFTIKNATIRVPAVRIHEEPRLRLDRAMRIDAAAVALPSGNCRTTTSSR